jgi:hypothetical protein
MKSVGLAPGLLEAYGKTFETTLAEAARGAEKVVERDIEVVEETERAAAAKILRPKRKLKDTHSSWCNTVKTVRLQDRVIDEFNVRPRAFWTKIGTNSKIATARCPAPISDPLPHRQR